MIILSLNALSPSLFASESQLVSFYKTFIQLNGHWEATTAYSDAAPLSLMESNNSTVRFRD